MGHFFRAIALALLPAQAVSSLRVLLDVSAALVSQPATVTRHFAAQSLVLASTDSAQEFAASQAEETAEGFAAPAGIQALTALSTAASDTPTPFTASEASASMKELDASGFVNIPIVAATSPIGATTAEAIQPNPSIFPALSPGGTDRSADSDPSHGFSEFDSSTSSPTASPSANQNENPALTSGTLHISNSTPLSALVTSTSPPLAHPSEPQSQTNSPSLSKIGSIIGSALGIATLSIAVGISVFFCCRRRTARPNEIESLSDAVFPFNAQPTPATLTISQYGASSPKAEDSHKKFSASGSTPSPCVVSRSHLLDDDGVPLWSDPCPIVASECLRGDQPGRSPSRPPSYITVDPTVSITR
ncbi:hypothetical protein HGRIS_010197 [Hohenbuehelia grisea]|uniref:Uncharacterized protein n=1 Tax=Hohenbuehelia grisea TaxID=104357 RepID=A0ABR3J422_9AGAR